MAQVRSDIEVTKFFIVLNVNGHLEVDYVIK